MESFTLSFYKLHMYFIEKKKKKNNIYGQKIFFSQNPSKFLQKSPRWENMHHIWIPYIWETIAWKQMLGLKLHDLQKPWLAKLLLPKYH